MYRRRAEYYDCIYHWKNHPAEAARLRMLLASEGIAEGSRLLEAACGTGSYLRHLRHWYRVSGFDLNEGMLEIARRKLPDVPLFRGDLVDFSLGEPVDALLCLFSSIGYVFPEDRLRSAARSFARAVRMGGALVVEPWLQESDYEPGRITLESYDSEELKLCRAVVAGKEGTLSVLDFHWVVLRKGASEVEHFVDRHSLWLCPTETLLTVFDEAGFDCRYEAAGLMRDRGLIIGRRRA